MAENKTKPTKKNAESIITKIGDAQKEKDCKTILMLMKKITKEKAVLWGDSLIGFGTYHYKYDSGREGDYFLTGFSPRKENISIYIIPGFEKHERLMKKLGKHKTGKSCLYIKKLDDINLKLLETLIRDSVEQMKKRYK